MSEHPVLAMPRRRIRPAVLRVRPESLGGSIQRSQPKFSK
jgi:hypothetical protein